MRIDIWSDIACPWCFIGLTRFERALAAFPHADGVSVVLHSFQLDPALPDSWDGTEASYLAERKGLPAAQVDRMLAQVTATAAADGLTMDTNAVAVANSRRAHRLLHAAAAHSPEAAWRLEQALFAAHFSHGESIADADVLVRLATGVGLDEAQARASLTDPALDEAVTADIDRARELGISGVPFFVLHDRYGISGAQPQEVFAQALAQVWEEAHPPLPTTPLTLPGLPTGAGGDACGPEGCA